jgi:hypothetical protein
MNGDFARCVLTIGLLGCGKVAGDTVDAPAPDADLTGSLRVITQTHVTGSGALAAIQAGVTVFSTRPNDSVVDTETSDSNGSATLMIYPGGSVTAVYPHMLDNGGPSGMQGTDLVTFVGVKDGDTLTFGSRFAPDMTGQQQVGTVTLNGTNATSQFIFVYTPCQISAVFSTFPIALPVYNWCSTSPWEVAIEDEQTSPSFVLSYGYTAVTLPANKTASIFFSANAARPVSAMATGLPPEITNVNFRLTGTINPSIHFGNTTFIYSASGVPMGGALTTTVNPITTGDHFLGQMIVSRPGNYSSTVLYDLLTTTAANWPVAAPVMPPYLNGSALFSEQDKAEWSIAKTTQASTFDGTVVLFTWTHTMTVSGMTTNTPYSWTFIVPPDQTQLKLPALPPQFAASAPQPMLDNINMRVRLIEIPTVNGYDALRAIPERNLTCPDCAVRTGEIPRIIVNN